MLLRDGTRLVAEVRPAERAVLRRTVSDAECGRGLTLVHALTGGQ